MHVISGIDSVQLTQYTDYALRVLLYAAENSERLITVGEIANFHQISRNHLMKVASELVSLGYLEALRGRGGGLRLARQPKDIVLGKLIRQLEPNFFLAECFGPGKGGCVVSSDCRLKSALNEALQEFMKSLDRKTLATVLSDNCKG